MSQQQRIFITGGSGFIGSTIIEYAIKDNYTVHALSRSENSDAKLKGLGAIPVRGDLETHDVLTREASAADIVISIADSIAGNIGKITPEERFRINNAAIDAIAKGLEGSGKALVVTSGSLYAAADPGGKETDENSPGWEKSPFGKGTESGALAWKKKGVKVCVVRLAPYVYGRGASGVKLFMGMSAKAGEVIYVDEGSSRITTVHVEDAARLYLLVAQNGRAGEIYNATAETHVTNRQLAEAYGKALGLPLRSESYADLEAKLGEWLAKFLSLENRASHAKAKRELGWEPEAEKGILDEIATGSYVAVAKGLRKTE